MKEISMKQPLKMNAPRISFNNYWLLFTTRDQGLINKVITYMYVSNTKFYIDK